MQINYIRLSTVKEQVDLKEVMQPRYRNNGAYVRIKKGVLVIVGSSSMSYQMIMEFVNSYIQKLRKQKKKLPEKTNVFWYA